MNICLLMKDEALLVLHEVANHGNFIDHSEDARLKLIEGSVGEAMDMAWCLLVPMKMLWWMWKVLITILK